MNEHDSTLNSPKTNRIALALVLALLSALVLVGTAQAAEIGTLQPTLEFVMIDGIPVPMQAGAAVPDFEPQERPSIDLGGTWKKERFGPNHNFSFAGRGAANLTAIEDAGQGRHLPEYDDSAWETKTLPAVESDMPGVETAPPEPFHGGVWYRRAFDVPASWDGKLNRLKFLGANYIVDVWVNGEYVGVHEGGYTPFAFDVSDHLDYGAQNTIAVRIDKPFPGARQDAVPSWFLMDWWSYTGVIQDIFLESAPVVSVVRTNVVPLDYNGTLDVTVVVANRDAQAHDVTVQLAPFHADTDAPGYLSDPRPAAIIGEPAYFEGETQRIVTVAANGLGVARFDVRVIAPQRWTPTEPNLYVLETAVAAGEVSDEHFTQFGVRTVSRAGGQLLLNGRVAFLPGVSRHEEWPDIGRSATFDRMVEDLSIIRDLNALFLRFGHYPNHPYTYLVSDRLGLAVMSEIPVYWFMSWNWRAQEQRRIADQMFAEMVLSGTNRPSVILWGTENECPFLFADRMKAYNQRLADDFHGLYDDGKLLTQSPAGDNWRPNLKTQEPLDVAGWTLYYGVFYGDDIYGETVDFIQRHGQLYPEYPIVATEFGIWSESDWSNVDQQVDVMTETFRAFADEASLRPDGTVNPDGRLAATTWFSVFDWYTKNGFPDFVASFHQTMGLVKMDRETFKPVAETLRDAYAPYAAFGGLGPEPGDYVDEQEAPAGDDDTAPDDDDDDDDTTSVDDDDDNDNDDAGCGC